MKPWAERFYNSDAWRSCRDSFLKSKGYEYIVKGLQEGLFTFNAKKANKAIRFIENF